MHRVFHILGMCHYFQIGKSVMETLAVIMVYFFPFLHWADEGFDYHHVDVSTGITTIPIEHYLSIPTLHHRPTKDLAFPLHWTAVGSIYSPIQTPDSPQIANLVGGFKAHYASPLLFHWVLYGKF